MIHLRLSRVLALAVLALACAADSVAAQSREEQLLSNRPSPRRGCSIAHDPNPLPSLDQLADSATLVQRVSAFAQQYPIRDATMFAVYSIAFDANGAVERVHAVDYMLPQGRADELVGLVRGALRTQRRGNPWSVRLRLEPGGARPYRIGRSEVCRPELRQRFTVFVPPDYPIPSPPPMRVRVTVGDDSRVRSLQILHGSGDREVDQWVEQNLVSYPWAAGLVDGTPVIADLELSLPIRARTR
jgi:hypothetical protein